MRYRMVSCLITFCSIVYSTAAFAATHEIGPGGDWTAVMAAAASGDTILVRVGAPAPHHTVEKTLHFINFTGESPVLDAAGAHATAFSFKDADGPPSLVPPGMLVSPAWLPSTSQSLCFPFPARRIGQRWEATRAPSQGTRQSGRALCSAVFLL
jgi:hypothetical protein